MGMGMGTEIVGTVGDGDKFLSVPVQLSSVLCVVEMQMAIAGRCGCGCSGRWLRVMNVLLATPAETLIKTNNRSERNNTAAATRTHASRRRRRLCPTSQIYLFVRPKLLGLLGQTSQPAASLSHRPFLIIIVIDKYSRLASTHIFCPFAVETARTWHEMAIELTQEIGSRIATIIEDTRENSFSNAFPWLCKEEMRFRS